MEQASIGGACLVTDATAKAT